MENTSYSENHNFFLNTQDGDLVSKFTLGNGDVQEFLLGKGKFNILNRNKHNSKFFLNSLLLDSIESISCKYYNHLYGENTANELIADLELKNHKNKIQLVDEDGVSVSFNDKDLLSGINQFFNDRLNSELNEISPKFSLDDLNLEDLDLEDLNQFVFPHKLDKPWFIPECTTKFSPDPLYKTIGNYSTTIAVNGDPADIYYPIVPNIAKKTVEFPVALMLQGALVDKSDYSNYAAQVASYGFVVVVPNDERSVVNPATGEAFTGLFAQQQQVNDVLNQMVIEDNNPSSPIADIVDTDKLGLLGHSFGGSVGLGALQDDICLPGICSEDYVQPPELMAGIFYGTSFRDPITNEFLPVNNEDIPTGLIFGNRDSVIQPSSTEETYDEIINPPKALITVDGANHYGITNEDNLIREPSRPTLDQEIAVETIARWSGLFLRAHLLGDSGAFDYVYNTGDTLDPNVDVISQTQPFPETSQMLAI
ncbi:MAG: hypothetical protein QNJ49_05735 [Mastigocoleus sp. MO_167.B18]|uniref:alpha/beta hydrolase family protein n=1 Tax=Mastigocoleus sp. MO_188.B34 TaxID=3036635 RepID=UPI00262344DF|nr:hypothetical protein [Mastigocoleus sp. MO_188.B34]MDJ0697963.1 hypothetical protein [Mastigocoleus sp. MO_188.B34]MDJ0772919.1 hypothetical protein [Mastigocoleus sp. MO_167.B18]